MKKFFFSMMAMLAFAGTAMAQGPKFIVDDVMMENGKGTLVIAFEYDRENYYNAIQFDLLLPDEVTASTSSRSVKAPELKDNDQMPGLSYKTEENELSINYGKKVLRVVSVNTGGTAFPGTSGTISIPLTIDATVDKVFEAKLNNGIVNPASNYYDETIDGLVDIEAEKTEYAIAEVTFKIVCGEAVGISEVSAQQEQSAVYNLAGQRVEQAQKGLFIQNGKKMVKK